MSSPRLSRMRAWRFSTAFGLGRCAALAAALVLAGCATDEQHRREVHARAAQTQVVPFQRREADLEDDGLPSQVPPPAHRTHEIDDPREPFSPNYGRPLATPPPRHAAAHVPAAPQTSNRSVATY